MRRSLLISLVLTLSMIWVLAACNQPAQTPASNPAQPANQNKTETKPDAGDKAANAGQTSKAADTSDVLAKVGETAFTANDLQKKIDEIPAYARKNFLTKDGKLKLIDNMIKSEMLYQAAMKAGYETRPDIQEKLVDAKKRILQSEYFNNEIKDKSSADESKLKEYYEQHKSEYKKPGRAKVAHIQINTEEEAKKAISAIKGGKDFAAVAKEMSADASSKDQGGELGWISAGGFIRNIGKSDEFEKAAFALKAGDVSEPVKTLKGWHVIKLLELEPETVQAFDEVKSQIAGEMSVTEEAIQKEFDQNKDSYMTRARVKAKHIQLNSEKEAQAVRDLLKKGGDFDKLAGEKSEDKATAKSGGDLGYIYKDGYIRSVGKDPDFENAAFALKVGEVSDVIKSKKGFHVVMVTEKEEARTKSLDEVRSQIKNKLMRGSKEQGIEDSFAGLKKQFNVQIFEDKVTDSPGAEKEAAMADSAQPPMTNP